MKVARLGLSVGIFLISTMNIYAQQKTSIAVLPLHSNGVSPSEALVLTDELLSVLVQSGSYTVLERSNMVSILEEQGFQMSGCTSNECAVEAGKLLGVKKMVAGSIGKLGEIYTISLRLFDVETGKIERNINQKHEGSKEELLEATAKLGLQLVTPEGQQTAYKIVSVNDQTTFSANRIGLWFGMNFPKTTTLSNVDGGISGALFYKARLAGGLYIQPEVSYSGSKIEIYEPNDVLKLEYLQIAALFSYELTTSNMKNFFFNLSAGPALNLILSSKKTYDGYEEDVKSEINENGFLFIFGMGIGIKIGDVILTLDGRYESCFDTIFKADQEWEVGKLQAFYILLGISL